MKILGHLLLFLIAFILIGYLLLPNPPFPSPPEDSLQSFEPADVETSMRRAYFTNFTRQEVLEHYQNQLGRSKFKNLPLPTYRLNYPPEDAFEIIRDQTRSTFLEEIVHPFRESLFINGFETKDPQNVIIRDGKQYRQKITVRYVPSSPLVRVPMVLAALTLFFLTLREWIKLNG